VKGRALLALGLACLPAGCGAEQNAFPRGVPELSEKTRRTGSPSQGISVAVPTNVQVVPYRKAPGAFHIPLGSWSVTAYAYPRREQLPRNPTELQEARRRLVAQTRRRGGRYRLIRSRRARVAGSPAVELLGEQTLSRTRLRTRSVHVYKGNGEYVFELLATRPEFDDANRELFAPMLRSLRLTGKVPRPARRGR
jgi:hypothetical protein